jgi:hypothetical protein
MELNQLGAHMKANEQLCIMHGARSELRIARDNSSEDLKKSGKNIKQMARFTLWKQQAHVTNFE